VRIHGSFDLHELAFGRQSIEEAAQIQMHGGA
jgi:hypothetical protein